MLLDIGKCKVRRIKVFNIKYVPYCMQVISGFG